MGNLSGPSVAAMVVIILALILAIVSMATDHWSDYEFTRLTLVRVTW